MEHAEWKRGLLIAVSRPKEQAKGICRLTHAGMAAGAEDIGWLDKTKLDSRADGLPAEMQALLEKSIASGTASLVNTAYGSLEEFQEGPLLCTQRLGAASYIPKRHLSLKPFHRDPSEIMLAEHIPEPKTPQIAQVRVFQHMDHHMAAVGLDDLSEWDSLQQVLHRKKIVFQLDKMQIR